MDTATRINQLLGRLDAAATILADKDHPDVIVQLETNAGEVGSEGIVECAITDIRTTPVFYAVTLTPTRRHCRQCGIIFDPPHGEQTLICPQCAPAGNAGLLPPA